MRQLEFITGRKETDSFSEFIKEDCHFIPNSDYAYSVIDGNNLTVIPPKVIFSSKFEANVKFRCHLMNVKFIEDIHATHDSFEEDFILLDINSMNILSVVHKSSLIPCDEDVVWYDHSGKHTSGEVCERVEFGYTDVCGMRIGDSYTLHKEITPMVNDFIDKYIPPLKLKQDTTVYVHDLHLSGFDALVKISDGRFFIVEMVDDFLDLINNLRTMNLVEKKGE